VDANIHGTKTPTPWEPNKGNHLTHSTQPTHIYQSPPPSDKRGVNLVSDALPFGRLWYGDPDAISNAIDYATFRSRSHVAVIHVYDEAGNVIETHEHTDDFKEW